MDMDLIGRVSKLRLSPNRCLLPVFEAIVNAIHGIAERKVNGGIKITVIRDRVQGVIREAGQPVGAPAITGFTIEDNGVGFTSENYASFTKADSTKKLAIGGKGVGRLLWLVAFGEAHVESVFQEDEKIWKRTFNFKLNEKGINDHVVVETDATEPHTTVSLIGFKEEYRERCPKTPEAIARRIVEHCIDYFIHQPSLNILLQDSYLDTLLDLQRIFQEEMRIDSQEEDFAIKGHPFKIVHLLGKSIPDSEHQLHYCADKRSVRSDSLCKIVPALEPTIRHEGRLITYMGYISGDFLDERGSSERTGFDISSERGEIDFPDEVTWPELQEKVLELSKRYLGPYIEPIILTKREYVRQYVNTKAQQYRPLLKHKPEAIDDLPVGLTEDKLDLALYAVNQKYDAELQEKYQELLRDGDLNALDKQKTRTFFEQFLEEWNEAGMSKLARHVAYRKATVRFMEKMLKIREDGKYFLEDAIHEVIFPLKKTSEDVGPDAMNLWMIDEKLAYHRFLASDKSFKQIDAEVEVEVDSDDRPDILIFNNPFAFTDADPPYETIAIIEFKRPMRNDYSEKPGKNPIRQVYKYAKMMKAGKLKDKDGRMISGENTRFYGYIVADMTDTLRDQAELANMTSTPDREGYFVYQKDYNLYLEIISFDKLIADAKKRNAKLFDELGIGRC